MFSQRHGGWRNLYFVILSACRIQCMYQIPHPSTGQLAAWASPPPEGEIQHFETGPLLPWHQPGLDGRPTLVQGTPSATFSPYHHEAVPIVGDQVGRYVFISPEPPAHPFQTPVPPTAQGTILHPHPSMVYVYPWSPQMLSQHPKHRRPVSGSSLNPHAPEFAPKPMFPPVAELTPLDRPNAVAEAPHSNLNTGASIFSEDAAHQPPTTESAPITPAPTFKPAGNTGASSAPAGAGQLHPSGAKASPAQLSEAKSNSGTRSSIPKAATRQSSHAETGSKLSESIETFETKDLSKSINDKIIQQRVEHKNQEKVEDDTKGGSAKLPPNPVDAIAKPKARKEELQAPVLQDDSGITEVHDSTFDQPSKGERFDDQSTPPEEEDLEHKTRFLKKVLKIQPHIPVDKLSQKVTKAQDGNKDDGSSRETLARTGREAQREIDFQTEDQPHNTPRVDSTRTGLKTNAERLDTTSAAPKQFESDTVNLRQKAPKDITPPLSSFRSSGKFEPAEIQGTPPTVLSDSQTEAEGVLEKSPISLSGAHAFKMSQNKMVDRYDNEFPLLPLPALVKEIDTSQTSSARPTTPPQTTIFLKKASQRSRKASYQASLNSQSTTKNNKRGDSDETAEVISLRKILDDKSDGLSEKTRLLLYKSIPDSSSSSTKAEMNRSLLKGKKSKILIKAHQPTAQVGKTESVNSYPLKVKADVNLLAPASLSSESVDRGSEKLLTDMQDTDHEKESAAVNLEPVSPDPAAKSQVEPILPKANAKTLSEGDFNRAMTTTKTTSIASVGDGGKQKESFKKSPEALVQVNNPLTKNSPRRKKLPQSTEKIENEVSKNSERKVLEALLDPVTPKHLDNEKKQSALQDDLPKMQIAETSAPLHQQSASDSNGIRNKAIGEDKEGKSITSDNKTKEMDATSSAKEVSDVTPVSRDGLNKSPVGFFDTSIQESAETISKQQSAHVDREKQSFRPPSLNQSKNQKPSPQSTSRNSDIKEKFRQIRLPDYLLQRIQNPSEFPVSSMKKTTKKYQNKMRHLVKPFTDDQKRDITLANASLNFGIQNVLRMEEEKLDLYIANTLAIFLNPPDTSLHYRMDPNLDPPMFQILLEDWKKNVRAFHQAKRPIEEMIGPFEGRRRWLTLEKWLYKHDAANKWKLEREEFRNQKIEEKVMDMIEEHYGISDSPFNFHNIPSDKSDLVSKLPESAMAVLTRVVGLKASVRRNKLKFYLMNRHDSPKWWEEFHLEEESDRFGLDVLTIIKVGDALHFGSENWIHELKRKPAKANLSYTRMIQVFSNEDKALSIPWIESAEREWLNRLPGNLYQERLENLSSFIQDLGDSNKLGLELLCLNNGLSLERLLMGIKDRKPLIPEVYNMIPKMSPTEKRTLLTWITKNPPDLGKKFNHTNPSANLLLRIRNIASLLEWPRYLSWNFIQSKTKLAKKSISP
ncbi:hypothetical protein PGT21_026377 [Puccinia graminis f. sp. tritici]|uniref:Uncharacterized protein n=2 Tax=Puccinia graminis f. sp. tritici TaxID=56615 RepID=A0A5B0PG19_PUCGR|nr:hypothetical protein PGT21_026377 [Puccinia graminis f. sp. tritici]